ncbi:MAG: ATP phosphoribosyltransferase [Rhizobiaceae bacterium]
MDDPYQSDTPSPTRFARVLSPRGEAARRQRQPILLPHGEKVAAQQPDEGESYAERARQPMSITLALPSKGRLKEQALKHMSEAGLSVELPEDDRRYRATLVNRPDIELVFLSASEIASEIGQGNIDLGVTGEDLLRETIGEFDMRVEIAARLGFGRADVVVAVPDMWLDVDTMADLDDVAADFRHRHGRRLRIATKYWRLTQQFFSQKHGIQVYRIVESLGATEGAPAAGSADVIVDITTTGSTLRANHLKVLEDGVILRSEACLAASRKERGADDAKTIAELAAALSH